MDKTPHVVAVLPSRHVGLAGVLSALLSLAGVVAATGLVAFFAIH